jgi:hypothetical protein
MEDLCAYAKSEESRGIKKGRRRMEGLQSVTFGVDVEVGRITFRDMEPNI